MLSQSEPCSWELGIGILKLVGWVVLFFAGAPMGSLSWAEELVAKQSHLPAGVLGLLVSRGSWRVVRSRGGGQGAQRGCVGTLGTHTRCPVVLSLQTLELLQVGLPVGPPTTHGLRHLAWYRVGDVCQELLGVKSELEGFGASRVGLCMPACEMACMFVRGVCV